MTPWTVVFPALLSMGFYRQEYWKELLFLTPGDLPDPEIEPVSPALAGRFFTTEPPGKPTHCMILIMGCSRKGKTMETVKRSVVARVSKEVSDQGRK